MNILAMDTSLGNCSVALLSDNTVIAGREETVHGRQSRMLLPMIEEMLEASGLRAQAMDAVACTVGPGGFTGIRVGLTAARMYALAIGKPFIGLTTLEVMVFQSGLRGDILAVIDAYRGQYYVQRFRRLDRITPLCDALLADEKALSALAHGAKKVESLPKAESVAALAYEKWQAGERSFLTNPLYIREPDAKLPVLH